MPRRAVYVGRPSPWGNPYRVGIDGDRSEVVEKYRRLIKDEPGVGPDKVSIIQRELRGRDLVCWCPLEDEYGKRAPCHADVLLKIANAAAAERVGDS